MLSSVMRLGLITAYGKEYKQLLGCMDSVWACLVSSRHYKVYEEIIDAAVMQRLVEEWLPSKVNLSIPTMDTHYNPMVVRAQALRMLRVVTEGRPKSERLVEEAVQWMASSQGLSREMATRNP